MYKRQSQGELTETDIPAMAQLDLAAHLHITKRVEGYATFNNALGANNLVSWRPFGARPTAPMQIMLGVKVR